MKESQDVAVKRDLAGAGLLSNGRYQVLITETGAGGSSLADVALTRWSPGRRSVPRGSFLYVQDLASGALWSSTYDPVCVTPDEYEAWLGAGSYHFRRSDDGIEIGTEICVPPNADVELRRYTLTNASGRGRRLRLTSYAEVVIQPTAADEANPAFSKLFVQTEHLASEGAVLARRRPRSPEEEFPVLMHSIVHPDGGGVNVETDRLAFVGRGRTLANPASLASGEPLKGATGSVLDPVLCLQVEVELAPDEEKEVVLIAAAAPTREAALDLTERFRTHESRTRAFLDAALHEQQLRDRYKLGPKNADRYHRLAMGVLAGLPSLRAAEEVLARDCGDEGVVESIGLDPGAPLLLGRVADQHEVAVARLLLKARDYWQAHGLQTQVVLLNDQSGGHADDVQEALQGVIAQSTGGHSGVVLRHADTLSDEAQCALQISARLVVNGERLDLLRVKADEPVSDHTFEPQGGGGANGTNGPEGGRGLSSSFGQRRAASSGGAPSGGGSSGGGLSGRASSGGASSGWASSGSAGVRARAADSDHSGGTEGSAGTGVGGMVGGAAGGSAGGAAAAGAPSPAAYRSESGRQGETAHAAAGDALTMYNGYGGFTADGREYVIRLEPDADGLLRYPPMPWTNVISNAQVGFIVSDSGAACTWRGNSRENRLTPWRNDAVLDASGEALYLHDEEIGSIWSPTPGPAPSGSGVEVRHGIGYTEFHQSSHGLAQRVTAFVPTGAPLKIVRLDVTNSGSADRRLRAGAYVEWVLGGSDEANRHVRTSVDEVSGAITAVNPHNRYYPAAVAFAALVGDDNSGDDARGSVDRDRAQAGEAGRDRRRGGRTWTASSDAFLGVGGLAHPDGMRMDLDGATGLGLDACAGFNLPLMIPAGETARVFFILGQVDGGDDVSEWVRRYSTADAVTAALDEVKAHWTDVTSRLQIETPLPELDLMVNAWLPYQNLSCRLWGRSAFYQSGGAFGFRDQLQDASAFAATMPQLTREQILLHASHQFSDGDVMHWWHPPDSLGIRTRFSDDMLWLPYVTLHYLATTGDRAILDEEVGYLEGPEVPVGGDEIFIQPTRSEISEPLYKHCCRAIDRSLTVGEHGLPLIGSGDWNDGMNRVGAEGRGESVWLAFFLLDILRRFVPICEARSEMERAETYRRHADALAQAIEDEGWDGAWYRRGYYDDGEPLGSIESEECKIDALVQAWSVLSGGARPARAEQALDSMEQHLVSEEDGIIRLLTPPFDRTTKNPGYIKGYVPGVRENGGQYTHAALWAVQALAADGRCERAAPLLTMLSPISHARTREEVDRYKVEPYVVAADVYGAPPHVGRGGWTWYTGSAGWMHRVAVESILGFRIVDGKVIEVNPCVPGDWDRFRITYRHPGTDTVYDIEVSGQPSGGRRRRVRSVRLDGKDVEPQDGAARIPLSGGGERHHVEVILGA